MRRVFHVWKFVCQSDLHDQDLGGGGQIEPPPKKKKKKKSSSEIARWN